MIYFLKYTTDALQKLIITCTTDISNSEINITNYGIIYTQTIGNKIKWIFILNNTKIMVDVKINGAFS